MTNKSSSKTCHGHDGGHDHGHDHGPASAADPHSAGGWGDSSDLKIDANGLARDEAQAAMGKANLAEAEANQRKLKRATMFVLVFFVVEVIGGVWSGSLAIISDAAHLLADVSGFILAMIANEIASRPACDKLTYGPVRAEVLSALFSTVTILVLSLLLVYSAICRIVEFSKGKGDDIDGRLMSFIALLGLAVNLALLGIFGHDHGGHGGHDHSHGHGHSHGHDDDEGSDGDHDHDHDHDDDNNHDEEKGLMKQGRTARGAETASNLAASSSAKDVIVNSNSRGSGESLISSGAQDRYGSMMQEEEGRGHAGLTNSQEAVAAAGGNGAVAVVEAPTKKEKNINMEAAVLHAVTDLVQSAGVLLAGLLIWYDPRWKWADPIATLFFVGLVINSTRWLLRRAFNVLLEGVPDSVDYERLRNRLSDIDGVTDLHCLHVWSLTLGRTVLSAHIKATEPERVLASAHEICADMGIAHSTIQVQVDHCLPESCVHPCVSAAGSCCVPEGNGMSPTKAPETHFASEAS